MTLEAMKTCPRFQKCYLNSCPLAPNDKQINFPSDYSQTHKEKCIFKSIRQRIGIKFNLANEGLTSRELAGKRKWDSLNEEEKQAKREKMRNSSLILRLSNKGYKIAPKSKQVPETYSTASKSPVTSTGKGQEVGA